jgi:hypothetical protein
MLLWNLWFQWGRMRHKWGGIYGLLCPGRDIAFVQSLQHIMHMHKARLDSYCYIGDSGRGNTLLGLLDSRRGLGVSTREMGFMRTWDLLLVVLTTAYSGSMLYGKSCAEVFNDIVLCFLRHDWDNGILFNHVEQGDSLSWLHSLPSWVRD